MQEIVNRCDRCKRVTSVLMKLMLINPNVEQGNTMIPPESIGFMAILPPTKPKYPEIIKDLCIDCTEQLCHWIDHQENFLNSIR